MRSRLTEMESANTRKLVLHDRSLLGWRGLLRNGFLAALWWWATNLMNAPRDVKLVGLGVFGLLVVTGWIGYPLEPRRLVLYSDRFVIWRTFRRYVVRLDDVDSFAVENIYQHLAVMNRVVVWTRTPDFKGEKLLFRRQFFAPLYDGTLPGHYSLSADAVAQELSERLFARTGRTAKPPHVDPMYSYHKFWMSHSSDTTRDLISGKSKSSGTSKPK